MCGDSSGSHEWDRTESTLPSVVVLCLLCIAVLAATTGLVAPVGAAETAANSSSGEGVATDVELGIDNDDSSPPFSTVLEAGKQYTFDVRVSYKLPDGEQGTLNLYFPNADGQFASKSVTGTGQYETITISETQTVPQDRSGADFGISGVLEASSGTGLDSEYYQVESEGSPPSIDGTSPSDAIERTAGDTVTFGVDASDPDGDSLSYTWSVDDLSDSQGLSEVSSGSASFSYTFDDPVDYVVEVEVSDGSNFVTHRWTISVQKQNQNRSPSISRRAPSDSSISLKTGTTEDFGVYVSDPDGDLSQLRWYVDGVYRDDLTDNPRGLGDGSAKTDMWQYTFSDPGDHTIEAVVYDSNGNTASLSWTVTANSPTEPPSVSTDGASDVSASSAVLSGNVDALGSESSVDVWFQYRRVGAADWRQSDSMSLSSTGPYSIAVSGLDPNTEYEFRAVARSSAGQTSGLIRTLTTQPVTGDVTIFGAASTPEAGSTLQAGDTYTFDVDLNYDLSGTDATLYLESPGQGSLATKTVTSGNRDITLSGQETIPSDRANDWQVSVLLETDSGEVLGADAISYDVEPLSTPPEITDTTPSESAFTVTEGAQRDFSVRATDPDGDSLSYTWHLIDIGESTSRQVGTGMSYSTTFDQAGDYTVRAVVTDSKTSVDHSWTVTVERPDTPPSVSTDGVSSVSTTGATVTGTVAGTGTTDTAGVWFEYRRAGTDTWRSTSEVQFDAAGTHSVDLSGLTQQTTYEYRLVARNTVGKTTGAVRSFTTSSLDGSVDIFGAASTPEAGSTLQAGETYTFDVDLNYDLSGTDATLYLESPGQGTLATKSVSSGNQDITLSGQETIPSDRANDWQVSVLLETDSGEVLGADAISYDVEPLSTPPEITDSSPADATLSLSEGERQEFSVEATDSDGDQVSYTWTLISPGETSGQTIGTTSTLYHQFTETGDYTVVVDVSDGTTSVSQSWTVTVETTQSDRPPVADAGSDTTVEGGIAVELGGAGSSDPEGEPLSYRWEQTGGPTVDLRNSRTETPSFDAPRVDIERTLTFRLRVSDDGFTEGEASTDTVSVTVTPSGGPPTAKLSLSSTSGTVGESLTASARPSFDPDGEIVSYAWTFGDGDAATGETVSHTYDSRGEYTVELTVTDDTGQTATARRTVTVDQSTSVQIRDVSRQIGGTVLEGIDMTETVTATVESNRRVSSVSFALDGETYTDTKRTDGWQQRIPMGDLSRDSVLTVTATTVDGQTATQSVSIPVLSKPEWLDLFVSSGAVSVDLGRAEVTVSREVPSPPVDVELTVPESIPVLGGPQQFETSSSFGITYDMLDETATLRGQGNLYVDVFDRKATGRLGAEGTLTTPAWNLRSGHVFVDVKVDAIGRSIEPGIETPIGEATIEAAVTVSPKVGLDVYLDNTTSGLAVTRGAIEPGVEANALVQTEALGADITGEVTGDLEGYIEMPAPYRPGGTASITGMVSVQKYGHTVANVTFFNVTRGIGSQAGGGSMLRAVNRSTLEISEDDWTLAEKYGPVPTARADAGQGGSGDGLGVGMDRTGSEDARLTRDRVSDKSPALAFDASTKDSIAVWSRQDPEKTVAEGRDIYVATGGGDGWTSATKLSDDRRMDTRPTLAVDGSTGRAVAVWTRVDTVIPETNVSGPAALQNSTELVYAVRPDADSSWSAPRQLTDNDVADVAPTLAYDSVTDTWQLAWERGESRTTYLAQADGRALNTPDAFRTHATVDGVDTAVSSRPDGGFTLAYFAPGTGRDGSVVVGTIDASGEFTERRQFDTRSFDDISVAGDRLVWADGPATGGTVHSLSTLGATPTEIPVGNVSGIQDLTLSSANGVTVLTYRGQTPASPQKRVYYRVQREDAWLDARPLTEQTATDLSYWQLSTALSDDGDQFRSVFLGRDLSVAQNNDVFAVSHSLHPDLALTASATNASVGSETTITYTVSNVGDLDIEDPVEVVVETDDGPVTTELLAPLDAGANRTGRVTVTVPSSGTVQLSASAGVTELTQRNNADSVGPATTDLTVGTVSSARNGARANVSFDVVNDGAATEQPVTYTLVRNGTTVLDGRLEPMAADTTRQVERTVSSSSIRADQPVTITVDSAKRVPEADESNNVWEGRLLAPDIDLWNGGVSYANASGGVNVSVSLANEGGSPTPVTLTLYRETGSPVSKTVTIAGSAQPNTTAFTSVTFDRLLLEAEETVEIVATSPYERRESNNALQSTVPTAVAPDEATPVVPGQPRPAGNLDGDPRLEDIDGDGEATLFDAIAYYNNRQSDVVRNNPGLFDFDGDGQAGTVFDALALYNEL